MPTASLCVAVRFYVVAHDVEQDRMLAGLILVHHAEIDEVHATWPGGEVLAITVWLEHPIQLGISEQEAFGERSFDDEPRAIQLEAAPGKTFVGQHGDRRSGGYVRMGAQVRVQTRNGDGGDHLRIGIHRHERRRRRGPGQDSHRHTHPRVVAAVVPIMVGDGPHNPCALGLGIHDHLAVLLLGDGLRGDQAGPERAPLRDFLGGLVPPIHHEIGRVRDLGISRAQSVYIPVSKRLTLAGNCP